MTTSRLASIASNFYRYNLRQTIRQQSLSRQSSNIIALGALAADDGNPSSITWLSTSLYCQRQTYPKLLPKIHTVISAIGTSTAQ